MSPHQAYPLLKHVKRQKKKIPCPYNNGPCSIVSLPSFVLPPPAFPPPTVWAFPGINNGQLARSRHNHQRVRCALLYFLLCAFVFFAFANFFFFFFLNPGRRFRQAYPRRRWDLYVRHARCCFVCNQFRQFFIAGSSFATLTSNGIYFEVGVSGDGLVLWASLTLHMVTD